VRGDTNAAIVAVGRGELLYEVAGEQRLIRPDGRRDRRVGSGLNAARLSVGRFAAPARAHIAILDGHGDVVRTIRLPCRRRRCEGPEVSQVAASPDGNRIVFSRQLNHRGEAPPWELGIVSRDGAEIKTLLYWRSAGFGWRGDWPMGWDFDWSPDGRWLAVADGSRLQIMRPDGSRRRTVVHTGSPNRPRWSPDGSAIAYDLSDADPGGETTRVVDIYTGDWRDIGPGGCPEWNAMRTHLIVTRFDRQRVVVMQMDGVEVGELPLPRVVTCPRVFPR
jgi:dipeptidyl aminopeptidase/acylaminoacyl peptidase